MARIGIGSKVKITGTFQNNQEKHKEMTRQSLAKPIIFFIGMSTLPLKCIIPVKVIKESRTSLLCSVQGAKQVFRKLVGVSRIPAHSYRRP